MKWWRAQLPSIRPLFWLVPETNLPTSWVAANSAGQQLYSSVCSVWAVCFTCMGLTLALTTLIPLS